jgi:SSS family solute:Na+ symporter
MSDLDLIIVAIYLVAILAYGIWSGRVERNAEDFFLAGRALPWALIGASLYASNMSGASFVGLIGATYEHGLVVFNYEWTAAAVLIVFAFFMLPVFLRARLFTVPEYLERRFDARTRRLYAALTLFTLMFIDTAGALYAGGLVISLVVPGLSLWGAAALLALVAGAYTVTGGLRAVVVTDAVQTVLMILGAGLVFWLGLDQVGGWDALFAGLDEARTHLVRPADDGFLPWHGVFGILLLGFYYWALNQYFVQRALAAKDLDAGRNGALFGGLLKLPNLALMILPGLIAFTLYPALERPDLAFPTLVIDLLPSGLRGLVVTALFAAIMSSLDSAFNAAASILTMDFVRPLRPATSERAVVWLGRGTTALVMAFGILVVPVVDRFGSLFAYFQSTLAYLVPGVVAVYFAGLFWRRATASAAFWTLVVILPLGLALFVLQEVTGLWAAAGLPPVHFTTMAALLFVAAGVLIVALSAPRGRAADPDMLFHVSDLGESADTAWYADSRWHAVGLGALTLALIAAFW